MDQSNVENNDDKAATLISASNDKEIIIDVNKTSLDEDEAPHNNNNISENTDGQENQITEIIIDKNEAKLEEKQDPSNINIVNETSSDTKTDPIIVSSSSSEVAHTEEVVSIDQKQEINDTIFAVKDEDKALLVQSKDGHETEIKQSEELKESTPLQKTQNDTEKLVSEVEGIRDSLIMKTKGTIFYKKNGPFSSWKSLFVMIDDSKQQMNFFKSQDENEKLARCKMGVDLRFVTKLSPYKQRLIQNKFPFKLYRRAGLSTIKLASDNEEDRAKWITTIEEIVLALKLFSERDIEKRSSTLPVQTQSQGGASTDSETGTSASAPENEENLIRPKKVPSSGFKVDTRAISNVKLKRTSSENSRFQQETKKKNKELDPKETFGVSLRRVNTEKSSSNREQSPEYIEFKQKYNSLSLSRKAKNAKLPLNEKSVCSQLVENLSQEDKLFSTDINKHHRVALKECLDIPRKRSPSPNIPISKGVETFIKNSKEQEELSEEAQNPIHSNEIIVENAKLAEGESFSKVLIDDTSVTFKENLLVPIIQLNNKLDVDSDPLDHEQIAKSTDEKINNLHKIDHSNDEERIPLDSICPKSATSEHIPHEEMGSKQNFFTVEDSDEDTPSKEEEDDPLKVRAIKQFIVRMNSGTEENISEQESATSIERIIEEKQLNSGEKAHVKRVKSCPILLPESSKNNTKEEVRLSIHSFVSQLSTESDEPLPRLNFMGKSNRSSTGSTGIKDNLCSDDTRDNEEDVIENKVFIREKSRLMKQPDSPCSTGGRSSLVAPEFTVMEEKADEIMEEEDIKQKNEDDNVVIHIATQQITESFTEELIDNIATNKKENIPEIEDSVKLNDTIHDVEEELQNLAMEQKTFIKKIEMRLSNNSSNPERNHEAIKITETVVDNSTTDELGLAEGKD